MNSRGASCVPFAGIRVNVKLIGSSVGDGPPQQFLTSFLVNDSMAIDAGSLGLLTPIEAQRQVRNVFITHSHIDHIGGAAHVIRAGIPIHATAQTVTGHNPNDKESMTLLNRVFKLKCSAPFLILYSTSQLAG